MPVVSEVDQLLQRIKNIVEMWAGEDESKGNFSFCELKKRCRKTGCFGFS